MMTKKKSETGRGSTSTTALRRMNRESIIGLLSQRIAMTRGQIAQETGLTAAAISRIAREMIETGILLEGEPVKAGGRVGRRESLLSINPTGAYVLAISLTANRRSITLANALGEVVRSEPCDDLGVDDPRRFLEAISARAKALVYDEDFNRGRLLGVGVSAGYSAGQPGSNADGLIALNPLGWDVVPVRATLADALGLPVRVEHRASAILRAELKSRPQETDIYLINVALGIGVAARLDGRFLGTGTRGFGSLSHFSLPGEKTPCVCGRRGCLEVTAAGGAILEALGRSDCPLSQRARKMIDAVAAADAGDGHTREAFRQAGRRFGIGVDAVFALLNPEQVILSGEVGRQNDFFDGLRESLSQAGRSDMADRLERSSITSVDAAISVALQEYIFTGELDLAKLKAA